MLIRELTHSDLHTDLLQNFNHHQVIDRIWVKEESGWVLRDAHSIRRWDEEKRQWIPRYLLEQVNNGGGAYGAFDGDRLVGFVSVDGHLQGSDEQYANLTMLFVDDEYQRRGIGRKLFHAVVKKAGQIGAKKLFISAIPAEKTISFYMAMACRDSEEIVEDFVDTPEDRYLEYCL